MPYYHCKNCNFTFKREGEVDRCPDCGKKEVRDALKSEIDEFTISHHRQKVSTRIAKLNGQNSRRFAEKSVERLRICPIDKCDFSFIMYLYQILILQKVGVPLWLHQ